MNLLIPIQLAFKSLRAQKTRSLLTILGVSIGIAVVIAIMAAGRGLDRMVMGQLEVFSPETISLETKVPSVKKLPLKTLSANPPASPSPRFRIKIWTPSTNIPTSRRPTAMSWARPWLNTAALTAP